MPLEHQGVARQYKPRRGTPTLKKAKAKLGVPLGVEGVARQALIVTWACYLSIQAWHANGKEDKSKAGRAT
ncbi:hypothetical protein AHAS_Ahas16G0180700 [Arachis hypogaea]